MLMSIACAVGLAAQQPTSTAESLLRRAIDNETEVGDEPGALRDYQEVVDKFLLTDRTDAATALWRMAELHQSMGDDAKAQTIYERLVQEFSDQKEVANRAAARLRERRTEAPRTIWTLPRDADAYRVSRDGGYIPFVDWSKSGKGNLFIRDLVSGTNRRLTTTGNGEERFATAAVVSSDSRFVAYGWCSCKEGRRELRIVPVDGRPNSGAEPIFTAPNGGRVDPLDWTPDGAWIAVKLSSRDRPMEIALVSSKGLKHIQSSASWRNVTGLMFSPDGSQAAVEVVEEGSTARGIWVVRLDGTRPRAITTNGDKVLAGWTPDSRSVVFASDRTSPASVWVQDVTGASPQAGPQLWRPNVANFRAAGVSRAGTLYIFPAPLPATRLQEFEVDFATGDVLSEANDSIDDLSGLNSAADWSSDGKQIVFVSSRPTVGGRRAEVLVTRSTETGFKREIALDLSELDGSRTAPRLFNPVFSRDGHHVVVVADGGEGNQAAYVIDLAFGVQTTIAVTEPGERLLGSARPQTAPAWSRQGSRVLYRRVSSTGFRLFEFDLASGEHHRLFTVPDPQGLATVSSSGDLIYRRLLGPSSQPPEAQEAMFIERNLATGREREITRRFSLGSINLSPDGRHFITGSNSADGTTRSMLLVSVADGRTREVLKVSRRARPNEPNPIPLAWAVDGQSVLLQGRPTPEEPIDIWWVPVDDRAPRRVLTLPNLGRVRVHPDGKRVVFSETDAADAPDTLVMFENFFPKDQPARRETKSRQ